MDKLGVVIHTIFIPYSYLIYSTQVYLNEARHVVTLDEIVGDQLLDDVHPDVRDGL